MDGFQRRLSAFIRTVKSVQYEDVQNLVREATSNDPVSAPDELIWKVIHAASMGSNNYALISEILWKRIGDIAHPLHVYKALTLLYHLLQHGDNKNIFREDSKNRIHEIRELKQYTYFKNEGSLVNDIRRAAATIEDMLLNPNKVVEKPSSSEVKSASERDASPHKNNVAKASPRTDDDQKRAAVAAAPRRPSTNDSKPKKAKEEEEPEPAPKPASKPRKKSSVDKTAESEVHPSRSGNMLAPPGGPSEAHRHRAPNPNAPPMPIDIINSGAMPVTPVDDILALAFNSPPQQPPRQFAGNPFEAIPVTDPSVQGQPFEEFDQNPWAEPAHANAQRK